MTNHMILLYAYTTKHVQTYIKFVLSVCIISAAQRKIVMMSLKHFIHNRRYVEYTWMLLYTTRLWLKPFPLKERTKNYSIPILLKTRIYVGVC